VTRLAATGQRRLQVRETLSWSEVTDFDELSVYGIEVRRKILFRGHVNLGLPRH
jgi:hypothetical protein